MSSRLVFRVSAHDHSDQPLYPSPGTGIEPVTYALRELIRHSNWFRIVLFSQLTLRIVSSRSSRSSRLFYPVQSCIRYHSRYQEQGRCLLRLLALLSLQRVTLPAERGQECINRCGLRPAAEIDQVGAR
jgi:hypothetical protein